MPSWRGCARSSMNDNFADAPESIGEIKAFKKHDFREWSVRDLLVYRLRQIDSGEIKPTGGMLVLRTEEAGSTCTHLSRAGLDTCEAVGALEFAKSMTMNLVPTDD